LSYRVDALALEFLNAREWRMRILADAA